MTQQEMKTAARSALRDARAAWGRGWARLGDEQRRDALAHRVLNDARLYAPTLVVEEAFEILRITVALDSDTVR